MVTQTVKNPPATWETWVRSLGWEDPLDLAWQPTLVFLPGEFHGQRSLVGHSPRGPKESDTTEQLSTTHELFDVTKFSSANTYSYCEYYKTVYFKNQGLEKEGEN